MSDCLGSMVSKLHSKPLQSKQIQESKQDVHDPCQYLLYTIHTLSPTIFFQLMTHGPYAYVFKQKRTKFGSEERKGPVSSKNTVPGPGQYGAANYDKLAATSSRREAPKFSFGGQNIRAKSNPSRGSTPNNIGPNSYNNPSGIGRQTISIRPSSPTWGLGSASRAQVQTVCSPGYKPTPKSNNPGPGNYPIGQSVGRQVLSTSSSSPSYGQGTATRPNLSQKSPSPGPGLYKIPSSSK